MTLADPGVGDVVVQMDVHPADALIADTGTTFIGVRATVADGQVQLWRHESAGPFMFFTSRLLSWEGSIRTGWTLQTEAGPVITGSNGGCNCGWQLGQADLWPGRRRVNTSL